MTVSVIESPSTGQRPDRIAPQLDARALLSLLDEVRPLLNEQQVPTDSAFLSWLSYRKLAVPVSALTRIPAWLTDSALIRCLDLPPAGGRLPASPDRRRRHLLRVGAVTYQQEYTWLPEDDVTTAIRPHLG